MNTQITEDYVSFEVAKLLKEKGFDEYCLKNYWSTDKELHNWNWELSYHRNSDGNRNTKDCAAPTLQMTMKWLMEVHKLYINVCPSVEGYYWTGKWHSYVENLKERYPFGKFIGTFNSPEDACGAAIRHCLTNLI